MNTPSKLALSGVPTRFAGDADSSSRFWGVNQRAKGDHSRRSLLFLTARPSLHGVSRRENCRRRPQPVDQGCDGCFSPARLQATLPDHRNAPAKRQKQIAITMITAHVLIELLLPECLIAGGRGGKSASGMSVPEAAVNQHDGAPFGQDDIGAPWKPPIMKPVTEPGHVQGFANQHFRSGVARPDAGHHA